MKNLQLSLKKKVDKKMQMIYVTIVSYVFVHYGLGILPVYQPDIYITVSASLENLASIIINRDGRVLTEVTILLLRAISGNYRGFYYLSLVLSIFLICLAIVKYTKLIVREVEAKKNLTAWQIVVIALLNCITIANLFSGEFFLYANMTVCFSLAIFLSVDAAICYIRYMELEKKGLLIRCVLELLIVVFFYEPIASIFVILTIPIILIRAVHFWMFMKNQFLTGVCYGSTVLIKYLFTNNIVQSDRTSFDQKTVMEVLSSHIVKDKPFVKLVMERITFGMWGYCIIFAVVLLLILSRVVMKNQAIEIAKMFYLIGITLFLGFLPFILRLSDDYKPRLYYPAGFALGIVCIYAIMNQAIDLNRQNHSTRIWMALVGMMIVIQWTSFVQMYVDAYVTNYEDEYISKMIGEQIHKYEISNKEPIEKVVFYEDANRTKYTRIGWCIIQRAYSSWGNLDALNYYLDKRYEPGTADQEIADYFSTQDWNVFSEDQVIFQDNTAHICMY